MPLVFKNIEFDQAESDIKEDMKPILDEVALFLVDHPTFKLEISGHTDAAGDSEFNLALSQDRADAIRKYIEEQGNIARGRIESFGFGSTKPLREEKTEDDRRINRRVEFRVIKPEKVDRNGR